MGQPKLDHTTIVLIIFYSFIQCCMALSSMSVENRTINAYTTYHFAIQDPMLKTVSDPAALLQISFYFNEFTLNVNKNYTCEEYGQDPSNLPKIYNCKALTSRTIVVDNPMVSGDSLLLAIKQIKNPSSVASVGFFYRFRNADAIIISQGSIIQGVNYLPGMLKQCNMTFLPGYVHQYGKGTIDMILGNGMPRNGSIIVTFEPIWRYQSDPLIHPVKVSTFIQCKQNPQKSSSLNPLRTSCSTSDTYQIKLSNALIQSVSENSLLSFSLSPILSPPTQYSLYTVTVQTGFDVQQVVSRGGKTIFYMQKVIDEGFCYVKGLMARKFDKLEVLSSENLYVAKESTIGFNIQADMEILDGDVLTVQLHDHISNPQFNLTLSSPTTICQAHNTSQTCPISYSGFNQAKITLFSITQNQSLTLPQLFSLKPHTSSGHKIIKLSVSRQNNVYLSDKIPIKVLPGYFQNITYQLFNYEDQLRYMIDVSWEMVFQMDAKSVFKLQFPVSLSATECWYSFNIESYPKQIVKKVNCTVLPPYSILIKLNDLSLPFGFIKPSQKINLKLTFLTDSPIPQPQINFTQISISNQSKKISLKTFSDQNQTQPTNEATLHLLSVSIIPKYLQKQILLLQTSVQDNEKINIIGLAIGLGIAGVILIVTFVVVYKLYLKKILFRNKWTFDGMNDIQFR